MKRSGKPNPQPTEQPKTFAEYSLEQHLASAQKLAENLVWQITNCGIQNVHTYGTAQNFLREYEIASAWAAVVASEKGR